MGQECCRQKADTAAEHSTESSPDVSAPDVVVEDDESLRTAIRELRLEDGAGTSYTFASHRKLELERRQVISTAFPECQDADQVIALVGKTPEGEVKEFIAVVPKKGGAPSLVTGSCQITYEDLSPSDCVEYRFSEDAAWAVSQLSLDALESYRGMKFDAWKQMLVKPTCEAQFRRMLQLGMVSRLFDPNVFPTPAAFRDKYKVTDERTGKQIELPHPVEELRVWDVKEQKYRSVDTRLTGAPAEDQAAAWWDDLIKQLKAEHGDEYIDSLIAGK
jgi:hypothetical protein